MNRKREILDEVAAGAISPEAAAALLREADEADPHAETVTDPGTATDTGDGWHDQERFETVRVRCGLAEVRVVGDPTVTGAVADGPHEAREEGSTLTIVDRAEGLGFTFDSAWGRRGRRRATGRLDIRANPAVALEVELMAGDLRIEGMRGPIRASVAAGNLRLDGFQGPLDVNVKAGNVEGRGLLTSGSSSVRCKLGEIRLDLKPESDVTVNARAKVGEVRLPDGRGTGGIDLGATRYVFGDGTASLRVETTAGSIEIGGGS